MAVTVVALVSVVMRMMTMPVQGVNRMVGRTMRHQKSRAGAQTTEPTSQDSYLTPA